MLPLKGVVGHPKAVQTAKIILRSERKSAAKKIYLWWTRIRSGNIETNCTYVSKSMGPNGMYPRLLRELAGVIVSPLLIICEGPWRPEEAPEDQEKANVNPVLRKSKRGIQQTIVWSAAPRSLGR